MYRNECEYAAFLLHVLYKSIFLGTVIQLTVMSCNMHAFALHFWVRSARLIAEVYLSGDLQMECCEFNNGTLKMQKLA